MQYAQYDSPSRTQCNTKSNFSRNKHAINQNFKKKSRAFVVCQEAMWSRAWSRGIPITHDEQPGTRKTTDQVEEVQYEVHKNWYKRWEGNKLHPALAFPPANTGTNECNYTQNLKQKSNKKTIII